MATPVTPSRPSPPLPERAADAPRQDRGSLPVADGCHLITFITFVPKNKEPQRYVGTLRVETTSGRPLASGDLYDRPFDLDADPPGPQALPDPAQGIPIFPLASYRYYLRVTRIEGRGDGFALGFEVMRFSPQVVTFFDGSASYWSSEGAFTALMAPAPAPEGFASRGPFFVGTVANAAGREVGEMSMSHFSPHLRRAILEIDRVARTELPLDNGKGDTWETVLATVGWDLTVRPSDANVAEPADGEWNGGEAHKALLSREETDLNKEWRYHMLGVKLIKGQGADSVGGERGYMYDSGGPDRLPREGFLTAANWPIPDKDEWGRVRGKRAGDTVTYFRTALHEFGHALGLWHNLADNCVMNATDAIAANSRPPEIMFPDNIIWRFSPDDEHRLRHWPDMVVRPGGTSPSRDDSGPVSPFRSERHRLDVSALEGTVPFGAPVRIHLVLTNVTDKPVDTPARLSLGSGFVHGEVRDSAGAVRTFSPLVVNENHAGTRDLPAGQSVEGWLTLLDGAEGPLFPQPGAYRVIVAATWRGKAADPHDLIDLIVTGEAKVVVAAPVDADQAEAARKVHATHEALLLLVHGGDHLKAGIEAVGAALAHPVLRPHFAFMEAKRLATRFMTRPPDLKAAARLLDGTTVMSPAEFERAREIAEAGAKSAGAEEFSAKVRTLATERSGR